MFLSIGMLKLNYFLTDIFILSAVFQPIKLSWRKIEWLQDKEALALFLFSKNRQFEEVHKSNKLMLMPMAWAFTRICVHGVWRYLRERRRSYKSTFFYCLKFRTLYLDHN